MADTDAAPTAPTAEDRIREYYEALRSGEPLAPFFAETPSAVKYGITEKLSGFAEIEAGLRAQTESTEHWAVESRDLRVTERGDHAWFADDVRLAWEDATTDRAFDFDTRWSGTLERRRRGEGAVRWQFVGMHVSAVPETELAE